MRKYKKSISHKAGYISINRDLKAWLFMLPMMFALYFVIWRPTGVSMMYSMFSMKGYTPVEFVGLENFKEVITDTQFWPTMWNTVQYVFWSFVIGFWPPLLLAIFLNEIVHFRSTIRTLLYLPAVVPGVVVMLLWYYMYYPDQSGLLNMLLMKVGLEPVKWLNSSALVIPCIIISMTWSGYPGAMLLYFASLQTIPSELYEASIIDGAGYLARIRHITLPQVAGVIVLNFVRNIIGVFQVTEQPMIMTAGGPENASLSAGYQMFKYGFQLNRVGHAMALGVIIFVVLILVTLFYFKLSKKIEENY